MRVGFMNDPDDCAWLRETALRGVPLPEKYTGFRSFVLQGNEDAPYAVNLYTAKDPNHTDDFFRVCFGVDAPLYCEAQEIKGA